MRPSRIAYIFTTLLLVLGLSQYIRAHAPKPVAEDTPKIIQFGLDTYKSEGPEAAVKAWLKGGPLEGSKDAYSQVTNLRQIQDSYGSFRSCDVIHSQDLSPAVRIIYVALNYERGPRFVRFILFRSDPGWIVTAFDLNAKPEQILPNLIQ